MAKVTGPLFSVTARGSFGPRLTFSRRKIVNQVRYQRAQKDYENEARATQRGYFSTAVGWWHELTPEEQAEWGLLGDTDC